MSEEQTSTEPGDAVFWHGPDELREKLMPSDKVREDPANVRRHGPRNLQAIKSSLARFGQQKPIVLDRDGIVRAGNGTLRVARDLGWTHVAVVISQLSGTELTAYAIADNRSGELAEWDADALPETLMALREENVQIADLGWEPVELQQMFGEGDDRTGASEQFSSKFELVVECENEPHQQELFEKLQADGLKVRVLTL